MNENFVPVQIRVKHWQKEVAKYNEDDIYRYAISLYLYALCAGLNRNLEATGPEVP